MVSGLKTMLRFMEVSDSRHNRSKSMDYGPVKRKIEEDKLNILQASYRQKLDMGQKKGCVEAKRNQSLEMEDLQGSLNQEILELQKRLKEQILVRHALERALTNRPFSLSAANENSIPKDAMELIKDIAELELEVGYLERYLLAMYRKTFDGQCFSLSTIDEGLKPSPVSQEETCFEAQEHDMTSETDDFVFHSGHLMSPQDSIVNQRKECNDIWGPQKLFDSSIHRSHSSLSQRSMCLPRATPSREFLAKAVDSYHSLPLSMLEQYQCAKSYSISLGDHLGTFESDHVRETPNWLSEEMIKCVSSIYCKLADPPLFNHEGPSSPTSFSSSTNEFFFQDQRERWSPSSRKFTSSGSHCDNPSQTGDSKEFSGPYCALVKVYGIRRESYKLKDIEHLLQHFRSLVYRLEEVDPRRLKHEEKLAFWINVHNALVMHAFLVYGIPQNNLKRTALLLKAAYNVGGHNISVDMIQSSILGCRMPRPGQWLRLLFASKTKFKARDVRRSYAIENPEPLLHFALCSGSHSDPAVRIYRPRNVFLELQVAKEEYIGSTISSQKEHKVLLPKIVESFAKDSGLCPASFVEMIDQFMPRSWRQKNIQPCQHRKVWKSIEWIPHNFSFRFLLSRELS